MPATLCPVCGSANAEERRLARRATYPPGPDELTLRTSGDCGHGWRPDLADQQGVFDVQVEVFDESFGSAPTNKRARWWQWDRDRLVLSCIEKLTRAQGGRFLDVGCGQGRWLARLAPHWQRFGIEISPRAAEVARRLAGAEVFTGPLEECPWAPDSFDVVTSFAVIEHSYHPESFVRGLVRLAKPGGLVAVMTGDRLRRWARRGGDEWPLYWPTEHVHFFSGRSLVEVARRCNLEVIRCEWRGMGPYSIKQQRRRHKLLRYLEYSPLLRRPHGNLVYLYGRRSRQPST